MMEELSKLDNNFILLIFCGKTEFVLDLLKDEYKGVFRYNIVLCNKAYKNRDWIVDVKKSKTKN